MDAFSGGGWLLENFVFKRGAVTKVSFVTEVRLLLSGQERDRFS